MKFILAILMMFGASAYAQESIKLGTANTVTLRGPIDDDSATRTALELLRLSKDRGSKDYPIYLVLDSPGGSVEAGEMFIEIAKTIPNLKTITVFAASMASAIVQALPGERLVLESGVMMFHRARGGVSGQFETGELESRLEFYKKYIRRMEQRSADRMGISLVMYKRAVKDELWFTSSNALDWNAADRVASIECSPSLIEKSQTVVVQVMIFQVSVDFSACPLLRAGKASEGQPEESVKAYQKYRGQK
jgi:ATP-dependent protease ClpP protease subunit